MSTVAQVTGHYWVRRCASNMDTVNAESLDWDVLEKGDTKLKRKQLGEAAGSEQLGTSLYELPAGKRSWPYHYHTNNEEAMFVLAGEGTLRLDGEMHDLEAGDYVAFPAAERGAHRVINDSDGPLRYLSISTMNEPDVTIYPDSEKLGVFVGAAPGGREGRELTKYFEQDADVDYWQDEET
jgi:uncharacterized cupin superfamily protein